MPLEQLADTFTQLNYFNGLFLQAQDFEVQRAYHVDVQQYLNYLLFDEGRLYDEAGVVPLEATANGHALEVAPGRAMVRDAPPPRGYEVHSDRTLTFDLDDPRLTRSDGTPIQEGDILKLTIEPASRTERVGTASLVRTHDRLVEQALIRLNDAGGSLPSGPHLVLADIKFHAAAGVDAEVTERASRGGVRLQILSENVIAAIGSGTGGGNLTGITLSPASPRVNVGDNRIVEAIGQFDSGSPRPLTAAGDGLVWTINPAAGVASIAGADTVKVTGKAAGTATLTASAGTFLANGTVTVVPVVSPSITTVRPLLAFGGQSPGGRVTVDGTQLHDPALMTAGKVALGTKIRLTALGDTSVVPQASIRVLSAPAGRQGVLFKMPPRASGWANDQKVTLELVFAGARDTAPYRYRP